MDKILILGATGHLASVASDLLFRTSPESLRLATSREAGLACLRDRFPGAEVVQADWNERSSLVAAMQGVSRLLIVTPDWADENLVTANIIDAANAVGSIELLLRLLAHPPGWTVDNMPPQFPANGPGSDHHLIARSLLEASGLPVCYVNVPAWIMFDLAWFVATEVQTKRRIALPAAADTGRMWVSEDDIIAVFAKVLTEPVSQHVGQDYVLTSADRYSWADIARIFSEQLSEPVAFVDDESALREVFGDAFDAVMTYFQTGSRKYEAVSHHETIPQMLGRPQQTLREYIATHLRHFQ